MGRATGGAFVHCLVGLEQLGRMIAHMAKMSLATACAISALHHWIYLWCWLALTCVCVVWWFMQVQPFSVARVGRLVVGVSTDILVLLLSI